MAVEPGTLRDATVLAMVVTFVRIAMTGIFSYAIGAASFAILFASGLVIAIALAFVWAR